MEQVNNGILQRIAISFHCQKITETYLQAVIMNHIWFTSYKKGMSIIYKGATSISSVKHKLGIWPKYQKCDCRFVFFCNVIWDVVFNNETTKKSPKQRVSEKYVCSWSYTANRSRVPRVIHEKETWNQVEIFTTSCNMSFCDDKGDEHTAINIQLLLNLFRSVQTLCVVCSRVKNWVEKVKYSWC